VILMAADLKTDLNLTDYSSYLDTVALSVVVITQADWSLLVTIEILAMMCVNFFVLIS